MYESSPPPRTLLLALALALCACGRIDYAAQVRDAGHDAGADGGVPVDAFVAPDAREPEDAGVDAPDAPDAPPTRCGELAELVCAPRPAHFDLWCVREIREPGETCYPEWAGYMDCYLAEIRRACDEAAATSVCSAFYDAMNVCVEASS